jgi:glutamate formiminotransferase/formiminotetrahydrofolate cyclodeaminase
MSQQPIVECVPNFSEGRDPSVIETITDTIEGVSGIRLLDVDPGADTNRTVVTFVGPPQAVEEAAFRCVQRASQVIDMSKHAGEHPRMGATDVLPFVPVAGVSMEDCAEMARRVGKRIGEELGIPIYLYEQAASRPERRNLARVRAGEYEGMAEKLKDPAWAPDFGPGELNRTAGVTAVGAREFLIAYNIRFPEPDEAGGTRYPCGPCDFVAESFEELEAHYAEVHGGDLRARYEDLGIDPSMPSGPVFINGRFEDVKAIGWVIDDYNRAQISMNLTNYKVSPPHEVLEAARDEARKRGMGITGSELVGLIPFEALRQSGDFYLRRMMKSPGIPVRDVLETAVQSMGLRDVTDFDLEDRVLGLPVLEGPLVLRPVYDFVDEVSRDTPAPGGGSVAALAGAIGGALASMVANLSIGKGEFDDRYETLCDLAMRAQQVKDALIRAVDDDTRAFDAVLVGIRMPKDTEAERAARAAAIQEGYKEATLVPMATVEACFEALGLCREMASLATPEMISDVGSGALMAHAGLKAAAYNVRINLPNISDEGFCAEIRTRLGGIVEDAGRVLGEVEGAVEVHLGG